MLYRRQEYAAVLKIGIIARLKFERREMKNTIILLAVLALTGCMATTQPVPAAVYNRLDDEAMNCQQLKKAYDEMAAILAQPKIVYSTFGASVAEMIQDQQNKQAAKDRSTSLYDLHKKNKC
jgi:hypothetical protein